MVMDLERLALLEKRGEADLLEVFSSIQGEGPHVGRRHLFVRFAHCDMHCAYCDTPLCHAVPARARIETAPGARTWEMRDNPVPLPALQEITRSALRGARHAATSLTGGEPLLHPWAIRALAPVSRAEGVPVLLETDGNLPDALAAVKGSIDIVSMDWKLASASGEPCREAEHRRFLRVADGLELYVKVVFVEETSDDEVRGAARAVAEARADAPFILQPCTPFRHVREAPSPERAIRLADVASEMLRDVRVIPQVHRLLRQP
jgi:organic radical activating enzyme